MEHTGALFSHPLEKTSDTPLYLQLKQRFIQAIATCEYSPDDPLPTEMEICKILKVSRATVRRCFADLCAEGRVVRKPGRGTFISPVQTPYGLDAALNFSAKMARQGKKPSARVLGLRQLEASRGVAGSLKVPEGTPMWELRRMRYGDGEPLELHIVYVPVSVCPDLDKRDLEASLYAHIAEASGMLPATVDEYFEAITLDPREAKLFGQKEGSAGLRNLRTTRDAHERIFEASVVITLAASTRLHVRISATKTEFSVMS